MRKFDKNNTKPFIQLKSQNICARFSFRKDVIFDTFGIVDINVVSEEGSRGDHFMDEFTPRIYIIIHREQQGLKIP